MDQSALDYNLSVKITVKSEVSVFALLILPLDFLNATAYLTCSNTGTKNKMALFNYTTDVFELFYSLSVWLKSKISFSQVNVRDMDRCYSL